MSVTERWLGVPQGRGPRWEEEPSYTSRRIEGDNRQPRSVHDDAIMFLGCFPLEQDPGTLSPTAPNPETSIRGLLKQCVGRRSSESRVRGAEGVVGAAPSHHFGAKPHGHVAGLRRIHRWRSRISSAWWTHGPATTLRHRQRSALHSGACLNPADPVAPPGTSPNETGTSKNGPSYHASKKGKHARGHSGPGRLDWPCRVRCARPCVTGECFPRDSGRPPGKRWVRRVISPL